MSNVITLDLVYFRSTFVEFSDPVAYPDAVITLYWEQATCYISDKVCARLDEKCRKLALNLMTAHLIKVAQSYQGDNYQGDPETVLSATKDKISVTVQPPPQRNALQYDLFRTTYGKSLQSLLSAKLGAFFLFNGSSARTGFRQAEGGFCGS